MIPASELRNPEEGLELLNRDEGKLARKRPESVELRALRNETAALREELAGVKARIEAARKLEPKILHRVHNCRTCFRQARDATILAIEER